LIAENILPGWSGWAPLVSLDLEAGTFDSHGSYYSGLGSTPSLTRIPGSNTVLVGQLGLSSADYFVLDATGGSLYATGTYEHGVQGYAEGIEAVSGAGASGRIAIVTGGGLYLYDGNLGYLDNLAKYFPNLGYSPAITFDAAGKVLYAVDAANHQIIGISMSTFVETQRIDFGDYTPAVLSSGEELKLLPDGVTFLLATSAGVLGVDRPTANVPTDGNDVLTGTAGDDTFTGGAGNDQINGLGGKDSLHGDEGNDRVNGGAADDQLWGGIGNDTLWGGAGRDLIIGDAGRDTMIGGSGGDYFYFAAGDTAGTRARADIIKDFSHAQGDRIDLSSFDTNSVRGGLQPFLFIGTAAFTAGGAKTAGELHYVHADGNTYIEGDANRDGVADLVICLKGTIDLVAHDFYL
jgi:Ca2+-binding RTX toxin-like protein